MAPGRNRGRQDAAITGWKIRMWNCVPRIRDLQRPARQSDRILPREQRGPRACVPLHFERAAVRSCRRPASTGRRISGAAEASSNTTGAISPSNPTSGGKYSAQYVRYLDRDLGRTAFSGWIWMHRSTSRCSIGTRVIALHGASSLTTTQRQPAGSFLSAADSGRPGHAARVSLQPVLRRQLDHGERRVPLGRVADSPDGRLSPMEERSSTAGSSGISTTSRPTWDSGCGSRAGTKVVFSFDTGFSHEGFQIWFRMNNAMQSRAQ